MKKHAIRVSIAGLLAVLAFGCGSQLNSKAGENPDIYVPSGQPSIVGLDNCATCHPEINAKFMASAKINQSGSVSQAPECAVCHNPDNDRANVYDAYGIQPGGGAVGCETCHGSGEFHYGFNPIPTPDPGIGVCVRCHSATDASHLARTLDAGAWADNQTTHHYKSNDLFGNTVDPLCSRCHTYEGSKKYLKKVSGTYADLAGPNGYFTAGAGASDPDLENTSPLNCLACHSPHGKFRGEADASGSAEFNTCTACHAIDDAYHGGDNPTSWTPVQGKADTYVFSTGRKIIGDTHVWAGNDNLSSTGVIAGYVMRAGAEDACTICHTNHTDDMTIARQWASSTLAGKLLTVKEEADKTEVTAPAGMNPAEAGMSRPSKSAAVLSKTELSSESTGSAWGIRDWDATVNADGTARYGQCQECHTATGYINFVGAVATGAAYDFKVNDFSHLKNWQAATPGHATTGSPQNEMLNCRGCHTHKNARVLNPGPMPLKYYTDASGNTQYTAATFPELGNSNQCVKCHSGRANMTGMVAASAVGASTSPSALTLPQADPAMVHNFTSASILFQNVTNVGYRFYANSMYAGVTLVAPHATIMGKTVLGAVQGPCVVCHMSPASGHTFKALDTSGPSTVILAQSECTKCHKFMSGSYLDTSRAGYLNALDALKAALRTRTGGGAGAAVYDAAREGFFFVDKNGDGAITSADYEDTDFDNVPDAPARYASWANMGVFGAASNLFMLDKERGAYVHNRIFAQRLLLDSLDWLDNGVMNGTITLDKTAYAAAVSWLGGNEATGAVARQNL